MKGKRRAGARRRGSAGMLAVIALSGAIITGVLALGLMGGQAERQAFLDQSRKLGRQTNEAATEMIVQLLANWQLYEATNWINPGAYVWHIAPGSNSGPFWTMSAAGGGLPATFRAHLCNPRRLPAAALDQLFGPGVLPNPALCTTPPDGLITELAVENTINNPPVSWEILLREKTQMTATESGVVQGMPLKAKYRLPPPPNFCYSLVPVHPENNAPLTRAAPGDVVRWVWRTSQGAGTARLTGPGLGSGVNFTEPVDAYFDVVAPAVSPAVYTFTTFPRPGSPGVPPGGFGGGFQQACTASYNVECVYLVHPVLANIAPFGAVSLGVKPSDWVPPAFWPGMPNWDCFINPNNVCGEDIWATPPSTKCMFCIHPPCSPDGKCPGFGGLIQNPDSPLCTFAGPTMVRQMSCFPPETRIKMANGEWKRADAVQVRDLVYNPVTRSTMEVTKLTKGPEMVPLHEIGWGVVRLRATETHPINTPAGPRQMRDLKPGDLVLGEDGLYHRLTFARRPPLDPGQKVINFDFDTYHSSNPEDHWVLADGIVAGDNVTQLRMHRTDGPPTFAVPAEWSRKEP